MRPLILSVVMLAGCSVPCEAPSNRCEEFVEEEDTCTNCQCVSDCCDCLAEFRCLEASASRCHENILEGGSIMVLTGCATDSTRCEASCRRCVGMR